MRILSRRWSTLFKAGRVKDAHAVALSFDTEQVHWLIEDLERPFTTPCDVILEVEEFNLVICELARLPFLDEALLIRLAGFGCRSADRFDDSFRLLLAHPNATERVAEAVLFWSYDYETRLDLVASCGWLLPLALKLTHVPATAAEDEPAPIAEACALLTTMQSDLAGEPKRTRNIVTALAPTWTRSWNDLLETSRGLCA